MCQTEDGLKSSKVVEWRLRSDVSLVFSFVGLEESVEVEVVW